MSRELENDSLIEDFIGAHKVVQLEARKDAPQARPTPPLLRTAAGELITAAGVRIAPPAAAKKER